MTHVLQFVGLVLFFWLVCGALAVIHIEFSKERFLFEIIQPNWRWPMLAGGARSLGNLIGTRIKQRRSASPR